MSRLALLFATSSALRLNGPRHLARTRLCAARGLAAEPRRDAAPDAAHAAAAAPPQPQLFAAALAFDLETTGLPPCDVVQIAVVCANSAKADAPHFSRLVLPSREIDAKATAVHGLTRELLVARGARPFAEVLA